MNEQLKPILADLRRRLQTLYGDRLVRLVLFGSQARGDAEPGSDIDVLVVLQEPVRPAEEIARTGEIRASLSLQHNAEKFLELAEHLIGSVAPSAETQSP